MKKKKSFSTDFQENITGRGLTFSTRKLQVLLMGRCFSRGFRARKRRKFSFQHARTHGRARARFWASSSEMTLRFLLPSSVVCPSVCLSICLCVCVSVRLSTRVPACLPASLPACLPACVFVCLRMTGNPFLIAGKQTCKNS